MKAVYFHSNQVVEGFSNEEAREGMKYAQTNTAYAYSDPSVRRF